MGTKQRKADSKKKESIVAKVVSESKYVGEKTTYKPYKRSRELNFKRLAPSGHDSALE